MNRAIADRQMKKPVEILWPPRLNAELREWLVARYPETTLNVIGLAAIQIDGLVRDMLHGEASQSVKVRTSRRKARSGDEILSVLKQRTSVVEALRRLNRTIRSNKMHLYARAFVEAPADAIALIDQVRGSIEWTKTVAGVVAGTLLPHPSEVEPHLVSAIALASGGQLQRWRKHQATQEIQRVHQEITGERPRQSYEAGTSKRSGAFTVFLDDLEKFYADRLPSHFRAKFGVQKSGRAMSRISAR